MVNNGKEGKMYIVFFDVIVRNLFYKKPGDVMSELTANGND
jgi:hypothetical protein